MVWWAVFFVCGILFPSNSILAPLCWLGILICVGSARCASLDRKILWRFVIVSATALLLYGGASETPPRTGIIPEGQYRTDEFLSASERARAGLLNSLEESRLSDKSRRLLAALLLGSRKRLGYELREAYAYLGISHFLALSGLHLGIILIPVSCILSLTPLGRRSKYFILFCFVLSYTAIARFPASLVRASALTGAFLLMRGLGRKTTLIRALISGCFVAAVLDRRVVIDPGFQLSFAAVCGIALVAIPLIVRFKERLPDSRFGRAMRIAAAPLIVTTSINAFTLPLVLFLFDRAPLLAPIFNLLMVVPVIAMLYIGAIYLVIPVDHLRSLLAAPIDWVTYILWDVPLRFSATRLPALLAGDVRIGPYIAGLALLILALRGRSGSRRLLLAIAAIFVSAALLCVPARDRDDLETDPVGERLPDGSVLLQDRANLLIIEGNLGRFEASRAVRGLWSRGIDEIEVLVVCPARLRDHGGIGYLASRISIEMAVCNPYLSAGDSKILEILHCEGIDVDTLIEDTTIDLGSLLVELRAPPYPPAASQSITAGEARIRYRVKLEVSRGKKQID